MAKPSKRSRYVLETVFCNQKFLFPSCSAQQHFSKGQSSIKGVHPYKHTRKKDREAPSGLTPEGIAAWFVVISARSARAAARSFHTNLRTSFLPYEEIFCILFPSVVLVLSYILTHASFSPSTKKRLISVRSPTSAESNLWGALFFIISSLTFAPLLLEDVERCASLVCF
ncbi:hypothetical protein MRB53_014054 [Persea americana]|uniref:Uncharacterized protein n=1 Tax=Persea americana TaxID=3435 RepID=A0ACC2K9X6_PERAE|nr:hypothetical protein MRB53_014054 [Persea americana]